ncbi:MAG: hypothetical protein J0I12_07370 [Candidatus Eremiobacteraeota bacterium]|nr:hypothetical protein [Candidatus Eremiobacteraeota bacterium]
MKISRHNGNLPSSKLPNPSASPAPDRVDRFESAPAQAPLWKRGLIAGAATGAGAALLSTFGACVGSPAAPLITGTLGGGLGLAAGLSQEGGFMGVAGGMILGTLAAGATVPGMLYGYEGALMAAGGGAIYGVLSIVLPELDKG